MRIVTEVDGQTIAVDIGPDKPTVKIGRLRECDLVVKNPSVSRRHCTFTYKNGMLEVEDLGSSAGTFVNGERVETALVDSSDAVSIGNQELRIEGGDPAPRRSRRGGGGDGGGGGGRETSSGGGDFDQFFSSGGGGGPAIDDAPPPPRADADGAKARGADLDNIDFSLPEGGRRSRRKKGSDSGGGRSRGGDDDGATVLPDEERGGSSDAGGRGGGGGGGSRGGRSRGGGGAASTSEGQWEVHFEGQKWPLAPNDAPRSVGRKAGVDILLPNPTVGRKHATIGFDGGKLKVVDLKSSNGTFVNGKKVREAELSEGDVVGFGSAEVKIVCRSRGGGRVGADGLPEPIDDWDEWGDEDEWDSFEMKPPSWHLVWIDGDERVTSTVMDLTNRLLAVGSAEDCDISVPGVDGLDPEHIELTWEEGALVVRDLGSPTGTQVNGRTVEEEHVLRNHDVIKCGGLRLQIIRGTQGQPARTPDSADYEFWAPNLEKRDDALSLVFVEYDTEDPDRRRELTLWGDGMGSVEKFERNGRSSIDGQATHSILHSICMSLVNAGFPEAPKDNAAPDEEPYELECELDGESALVILTKATCGKSEHYSEALELLKAILHAWDPVG